MVPEAKLAESVAGLVPASSGWFVLNARDGRWFHKPGRGDSIPFTGCDEYRPTSATSSRGTSRSCSKLGDGTEGIVGVVTAYHDVNRRQPPKPSRLPRYREITETSGIFGPGTIDAVNGTELIHIWLDHLLVLSMLQHPSRAWRWGRLVVVHPAGNTDFADACSRYRALLLDQSTFSSVAVEEATALRKRYLPS